VTIAESIVKARAKLDTLTKVNKLFGYIVPLIRDEGEAKVVSDADRFEFDQEQNLVARLFHNIVSDDTDTHFKLYAAARKHFGRGGTQRIEATLPALVFGSLQLVPRIRLRDSSGGGKESLKDKEEKEEKEGEMQVKPKKVFGFVHETISVLSPHYPDLALRLFLQAAMCADIVGYEAIAYEFIAQAFLVYEDEVSESKAQFNAITYIISCLDL